MGLFRMSEDYPGGYKAHFVRGYPWTIQGKMFAYILTQKLNKIIHSSQIFKIQRATERGSLHNWGQQLVGLNHKLKACKLTHLAKYVLAP